MKCRLALALGWKSVAALERGMSEREFRMWIRFATTHLMPDDRMEAYLAQVASVIAQSVGNADARIKDFLLDFTPKKTKESATDSAYAIANIAQGPGVRKLGQGRKKK